MPTKYGTIITDLNVVAAADPTNEALIAAKAEKDLLVAEFQALKAHATAILVAIDGV